MTVACIGGWKDLPLNCFGVFESEEVARKAFLAAGCIVSSKGEVLTTPEFGSWMAAHKLSFYSVGGDIRRGWCICFKEVPINIISNGYDDD